MSEKDIKRDVIQKDIAVNHGNKSESSYQGASKAAPQKPAPTTTESKKK